LPRPSPRSLLRLKGHLIIVRRYKSLVGEIDLAALKGKPLAFVEVKQRRTFEDAGWSQPVRARRRISGPCNIGSPCPQTTQATTDVVLATP
jgi:hypothetical protein